MVVSHHPRALKCEAAEVKLATASRLNPEGLDVVIKNLSYGFLLRFGDKQRMIPHI